MSETTGKIEQLTAESYAAWKENSEAAGASATAKTSEAEELLATAMTPIPPREAYEPTRLEYFAVQILQGLIIGRSDQILPKVVKRAISLSRELELALDVEQNL